MNHSDTMSLALHQAIADLLNTEPVYVLARGLQRLESKYRGRDHAAVDRWAQTCRSGDLRQLHRMLTAEDDEGNWLRANTVFEAVLTSHERDTIVSRTRQRH